MTEPGFKIEPARYCGRHGRGQPMARAVLIFRTIDAYELALENEMKRLIRIKEEREAEVPA